MVILECLLLLFMPVAFKNIGVLFGIILWILMLVACRDFLEVILIVFGLKEREFVAIVVSPEVVQNLIIVFKLVVWLIFLIPAIGFLGVMGG